jgi:hypothetical protein
MYQSCTVKKNSYTTEVGVRKTQSSPLKDLMKIYHIPTKLCLFFWVAYIWVPWRSVRSRFGPYDNSARTFGPCDNFTRTFGPCDNSARTFGPCDNSARTFGPCDNSARTYGPCDNFTLKRFGPVIFVHKTRRILSRRDRIVLTNGYPGNHYQHACTVQ